MKILQTNLVQTNLASNKPILHKRYESSNDTFEKTSVQQPSFKQNYSELLKHLNLDAEKSLMAIGGLVLVKEILGAANNQSESASEENSGVLNFFNNLIPNTKQEEKTEQRIQALEEENKGLKKIITDMQKQLVSFTEELKKLVINHNCTNEQNNDTQNTAQVQITFPKKHGRYPKKIEILKKVVESINFEKEIAEKVMAICVVLTGKDINSNLDKLALSEEFAKELESTKNDKSKQEEIVQKYYIECGLAQVAGQKDSGTQSNNTTATGTVNPSEEASGNTNNAETNGSNIAQNNIPIGINPIVQNGDADLNDKPIEAYTFRLPQKINEDVQSNMSCALRRFKEMYEHDVKEKTNENVNWSKKKPLSKRVLATDVANEIRKCNKRKTQSRFKDLKISDSEYVADIINSDPRFRESFNLHAAMKFIERLMVLEVEDKASKILDVFTNNMQYALKQGVKMVKHDEFYENVKDGTIEHAIGTNIIIPHNYYDDDAYKLFGTFDLKVGISENCRKPGSSIISSVFLVGV